MSFPSYVTLLNIGISKSLYFPANPIIVTFSVAELDLIVHMHQICTICSSVDIHLGWLYHFIIVTTAETKTHKCVSISMCLPRNATAGFTWWFNFQPFIIIIYYYWETSMLISIMTGLSKVFFWFIFWALLIFLDIFIISYLPILSPLLDPQLQVDIWPSVVISLLANVLFMLSYFS